jgi:hypothetical protein
MTDIVLTDDEMQAISALKRLARQWPRSLWLFSASGSLEVMKKNDDGEVVMIPEYGGVDPAYSVATIDIENDGGDW